MEQHPVPQNVTTFQFRLIGDMTIKQFGYLAGGAILAFISYKLPLPFFFTWPMTVFFALLGFGFAFVPIEERPMDIWVLSFLRNVYSPTQYIWHRIPSGQAAQPQQPQTAVKTPQQQIKPHTQTPPVTTPQTKPQVTDAIKGLYTQQAQPKKKSIGDLLFGWLDNLFPGPAPKPTTSVRPAVLPVILPPTIQRSPIPSSQQQQPPSEFQTLQDKIQALEKQLDEKAKTEFKTLELQKQMAETVKQKQYVEQELAKLRQKQPAPAPEPPGKQTKPQQPTGPTVKIIPPEATRGAGLPRLTTFPNIVTGIVKDNVSALLPGVLITIRDKDGVPLRALKTNKLGQFAASTQLPNGMYIVEVEDPRGRFVFDKAQISLTGAVMPAIEIVAKSKRDIDREQLSKQIFGQTTNS